MVKYYLLTSLFIFSSCQTPDPNTLENFTTIFEASNGTKTPTYFEVIEFYTKLADIYSTIDIKEIKSTDSGYPLHLVTYSTSTNSTTKKNILLINNGIHPGESDGIDASMLLLRDLAQGKIKSPQHTTVAVIPIYNIGGALQRNSFSRTNQNGPEAYGFRGNARNYDLNRDFIKADTKNAAAFAKIFQELKPQLFIDNHVSNGADYQYTLTHLFTQHNKLGGVLGDYLQETFMPQLELSLSEKKWDITPYVNVFNTTPESGFSQFMDHPRYSTGYTTLFNSLGMMVETHMLKPYKDRVTGTYQLMKSFIEIAEKDALIIQKKYTQNFERFQPGNTYPIAWTIDSSKTTNLNFKGYEATIETSEITRGNRLKYHQDQPFERPVIYYNHFKEDKEIIIPKQYIIPKGYWHIIEKLQQNNIKLSYLESDTTLLAETYNIKDYKTYTRAYEGHYPHYNTITESRVNEVSICKGDVVVSTEQFGVRYILETLEPSAVDSFFNWNFFDTILQQKEGFSNYVWEDTALKFLKENPDIKTAFDAKKSNDKSFANNPYAQLDWLHKQSPYYEKAHLQYPILRVMN